MRQNHCRYRGPIACTIPVPDSLLNYTGGIYRDETNSTSLDHDISVVGYGIDKVPENADDLGFLPEKSPLFQSTGLKFWHVRNSWGTYWGEQGFFKVIRGVNNLQLESGNCAFAVPEDTWSEEERRLEKASQKIPKSLKVPNSRGIWAILSDFIRNAEDVKDGIRTHHACTVQKLYFERGEVVKASFRL